MREELIQLIIARLDRDAASIKTDFVAEKGVTAKHTAIDDLLPPEIAERIAAAFPVSSEMRLMDSFRERKFTSKSL
ncbi:MAG: 2OG-Fe(II) oxygenase, partial [Pyrinomonadaceae bacterium]